MDSYMFAPRQNLVVVLQTLQYPHPLVKRHPRPSGQQSAITEITKDSRHIPFKQVNSDYIVSTKISFWMTGSSGFIGAKVVEILLDYGFSQSSLFRSAFESASRLQKTIARFDGRPNVELVSRRPSFTGGLRESCRRRFGHLPSCCWARQIFCRRIHDFGTRHSQFVGCLFKVGKPTRFVNVSSFAVYSNLGLKRDGMLDETCPLENAPQERFDAYGFGKLKQEEVVREYGREHKLPYVILRPGYVFGPGKRELSGRVGINTFGFFIQVNGSNLLPLSFIDNCAEAIVLAGLRPGVEGEVFNVVDDELISGRQFLEHIRRR